MLGPWLAAPALLVFLLLFRRELAGALNGQASPALLAGLALGGLLTHLASGRFSPEWSAPVWDQWGWSPPWARLIVFGLAGLLLGFGGRAMGRASRRDLLVAAAAAALGANLLYGLLEGLVGS